MPTDGSSVHVITKQTRCVCGMGQTSETGSQLNSCQAAGICPDWPRRLEWPIVSLAGYRRKESQAPASSNVCLLWDNGSAACNRQSQRRGWNYASPISSATKTLRRNDSLVCHFEWNDLVPVGLKCFSHSRSHQPVRWMPMWPGEPRQSLWTEDEQHQQWSNENHICKTKTKIRGQQRSVSHINEKPHITKNITSDVQCSRPLLRNKRPKKTRKIDHRKSKSCQITHKGSVAISKTFKVPGMGC